MKADVIEFIAYKYYHKKCGSTAGCNTWYKYKTKRYHHDWYCDKCGKVKRSEIELREVNNDIV